MTTAQTIAINNTIYDSSDAISYHYGGFPPEKVDLNLVFEPLTAALQNITRFDEQLKHMQNSELLLAPLRQRDAVVSSRMEGTISTLEEVLRLEASALANREEGTQKNDTVEVSLYARALRQAEGQIREGTQISEHLIRNAHQTLLSAGRGAQKNPGNYKAKQNHIGDRRQRRVDFIPVSPDHLAPAMHSLIQYIRTPGPHELIKTAVAHAEFEALHPFEDGNGRVGRMLIPLMLWQNGILSAPHFFVSDYFERHKDDYIEGLRQVSLNGAWSEWCCFFLTGLASQAEKNIEIVSKVQSLYEETKERFREVLRSQFFISAVDYMFSYPVFWNNHFVDNADGPKSTLRNFTQRLVAEGLVQTIIPPSGRAPGLYAFPALLEILSDEA